MVVYEKKIFSRSDWTKKKILIENYYKTIYEPVRIDRSSYRVQELCNAFHTTVQAGDNHRRSFLACTKRPHWKSEGYTGLSIIVSMRIFVKKKINEKK